MDRPTVRPALLSLLLALSWPAAGWADVAVIVHRDCPVRSLSAREVSDLYLGRSRHFVTPDHNVLPATVYEQQADSPLREAFFRLLNGMPISHVNAYWARLRFSGQVLPPVALPDSHAVVDAVSRNPGAIGYVDEAAVGNAPVKITLRLKK
jgi:ABC-type phosphate transport system substrate-binding protein